MKGIRPRCLLFAVLLAPCWIVAGQQKRDAVKAPETQPGTTKSPQPAPAVAAKAGSVDPSQYVLGPDDVIKIWALGMEEISDKPVRIDPGGYVDLPLLGRIRAGGLTIEEFKADLIKRVASEVRRPEVSIEIVEFGSQPVSVMGAVNHPGVVQLRGRKTLAEALSLAGGLAPDAGAHVKISRPVLFGGIPLPTATMDASQKFTVAEVNVKDLLGAENPAQNIQVQPHDVITVPRAEMVYVIGEVHKPGAFVLNERENVSILQALSMAEGLGPTPAAQNSKILRPVKGSTQRREIPVDVKKILKGKAEDVALRPNDILFVPSSTPKKAARRALEAVIQTASGIAIWRRPIP